MDQLHHLFLTEEPYPETYIMNIITHLRQMKLSIKLQTESKYRVKSGMFRQTAKFGQRSCLFHTSIIGIKNKLTKQTVEILMRRLIRSRLIWISTVCKINVCPSLPDVRIYPTLPIYFQLE